MPRVIKIEIVEEASTLKKRLVQQKDKRRFERVQALYLLKIRQVETVEHLAVISGRGRRTISRWLSQYRSGGLAQMLEVGKSPGKEPLIPQWAVERLKAELADPEGFTSYKEVKLWLEALLDIKVKYDVVHHLVHDKLKAKLKVPRPVSAKQAEGAFLSFQKIAQVAVVYESGAVKACSTSCSTELKSDSHCLCNWMAIYSRGARTSRHLVLPLICVKLKPNWYDYCGKCVYNANSRTGEKACPFNFFYWDFLSRHYDKLKSQDG